ncbi:MAG TPA: hypothetical protein VN862_04000 [Candidatus Acidoferrales bacterium]|nr:hypothetical protein [Candidatus Acidoferrales bacterium]
MPTRDELHSLVNTLPEAALTSVHVMLERFQVWPPQPLRGQIDMRDQSFFGGRSISFDPIAKRKRGSQHFSAYEGDTYVCVEKIYFNQHEFVLKSRLEPVEQGKKIACTQQIEGPNDQKYEHNINLDLPE